MSYVLGIDVGGSTATAAVCRYAADAWSAPQRLPLDARSPVLGSALEVTPEGAFAAGTGPDGRVPQPARVVRDLMRRVGDGVRVFVGGTPYPPQSLIAALVRWVVDTARQHEDGPAERVVLAHPSGWGGYRRDLMARALHDIGLPGVVLLPAALAVAHSHEATGWLPAAGLAAVCRIGGRGVEASVLELAGPGGVRLLGTAELESAGGADLDEALLARVMAAAGPDAEPPPIDHCTAARERLSVATEVAVDVPAPRAPLRGIRVRLSRADLDPVIRPIVRAGVDLLLQAVHEAGARPADLSAVLLAGGAAGTPLVAEILGEVFAGPVLRDDDPQSTVAGGAALAGRWSSHARPPIGAARPTADNPPRPRDLRPPAPAPAGPAPHDDREMRDAARPARPPVRVTPVDPPARAAGLASSLLAPGGAGSARAAGLASSLLAPGGDLALAGWHGRGRR
jgi:molecular chaperone DnaK (HSP70)